MTESNKQILELIKLNASLNEISEITGLSNKQIFYRLNQLKNQGYSFQKKYYYTGDIVYNLENSIKKGKEPLNEATILTSEKDTEFKALLISDLHIASIYEEIDALDKIYNYCAKEGIRIIINCGDIIDGHMGPIKKIYDNIDEQVDYLLKVYPYDKNILNFVCLGNHDYSALSEDGLDLIKTFENKRHDFVTLGYGYGKLNIKNDHIILRHPIQGASLNTNPYYYSLVLNGHSHQMKHEIFYNNILIYVPSLSNLKVGGQDLQSKQFPGAIKMTISFNNGFFKFATLEHLLLLNNIYTVSETKIDTLCLRHINCETDFKNNIEERTPIKKEEYIKKLILTNNSKRISQTDKFKKDII